MLNRVKVFQGKFYNNQPRQIKYTVPVKISTPTKNKKKQRRGMSMLVPMINNSPTTISRRMTVFSP